MKKPLKLPPFKNEDAERDFWAKLDLSEYYEPSDLEPVSFPNLKPTSRSISKRKSKYTGYSVSIIDEAVHWSWGFFSINIGEIDQRRSKSP